MREGKGYDVILQAFSGMLAITGERDGPPVRSPFSPVDQATGLHALIGILALLNERARGRRCVTFDVAEARRADGFLQKPFPEALLHEMIDRVLRETDAYDMQHQVMCVTF